MTLPLFAAASRPREKTTQEPPLTRPPHIAVLGAGAAGVAAALRLSDQGAVPTVFERSWRTGGSVDSRPIKVGDRRVELGASDLNRRTFVRIAAMIERFGLPFRPIHASTGFFTEPGDVTYALGRRHGVQPPEDVLSPLRRFRREAPEVLHDDALGAMTLDAWLAFRGYPEPFAKLYLRPRVAALWSCGPDGPGAMPMWAVMRFFAMQEGLVHQGDPKAERVHLPGGFSTLIDAAISALPADSLRRGREVRVVMAGPTPQLHDGQSLVPAPDGGAWDAIVCATQAEDAANLLDGGGATAWKRLLRAVPYQTSRVTAHLDARLLGPNPNAWGSFNVLIRPVRRKDQFTITLVGPLHQHDAEDPARRGSVQPWFFTTANPWRPIPDTLLLRGDDNAPVEQTFRHAIVDRRTAMAQAGLRGAQGQGGLWVAGAYTEGVGLLEDAWRSGEAAADGALTAWAARPPSAK